MTDVTVHSRKIYGHFDYGEPRAWLFFHFHRCTKICQDWPKLCDAPLQNLDFEDTKKRVHFDMKLDKVIFTHGSLKQRQPVLRRYASDEGAKLRKKWMDRFNRSSQLHPLAATDGPPPYEDLPHSDDSVVQRRLKSWTIAEISYSSSPLLTRRATDFAKPTKSCLKRTFLRIGITKVFRKLVTCDNDHIHTESFA
ncbi:hypothetical protein Btru_041678 [Bulinus truncatus]|nr:hypothetical protein Btru_041678 [Bulinus truncatus]